MTARALVVVGRGRMGVALHRMLRAWYARAEHVEGRGAAREAPVRPKGKPVTWILAVSDRAIAPVSASLAPVVARGDVVFHLAGMLGPDALEAVKARGAAVGSLHPLYAVAASTPPITRLVAPAFLFEGDRKALPEARQIARRCGGTLLVASRVDRARYHAAAALMATGAVALAQGAARLWAGAIEPPPSDEEVVAAATSLLRSVTINVQKVGVERALASPLLRDDTDTVARHLESMRASPAVRDLYRAAVALVIEALEGQGTVSPATLATARRLVGETSRP